MKLPLIKELVPLIKNIKKDISDEYLAFEGDDMPGIQLTIGWDADSGNWSYQTGDNSYSGSAYGYPHWAVVGVYRRSNALDLARDIREQLADLASW
jgi:hypothetical protein